MEKKKTFIIKLVLIIEIVFFLLWRFSGLAPRPIPLGTPLFIVLISISFLIPASFERKHWIKLGLTKGGLNMKTFGKSIIVGSMLSLVGFLLLIPLFEWLTHSQFDMSFFEQLRGNTRLLFAAIGVSIIYAGFGEEMIYRGFLLNRIIDLLPDTKWAEVLAVLSSSVIFALAHSYQGIVGILSSGTIGMILCIVYLRNGKNLWFVIFSHAIIDIVAAMLIYLSVL